MELSELTLHNVGVYHGKQTVDLRTTPEQPIVLIGGLNGCGKTTLLDALQLCLYGNRARCAGRGSLGYEAYLRGLISRRATPADGASIQLTFHVRVDGQDRDYRVVRSWAQAGQGIREFVSVFVDGRIDPAKSDGWADHVEDLLPLELSSLFLFDGEKVKDLADPGTASTVIRTAVDSLLGVGALEQLRSDLIVLRQRQKSDDEDVALRSRIDELLGRLEQLTADRDALTQKRASVFAQRAQAAEELDHVEAAFAAEGGDVYARRSELESEQKRLRIELDRSTAALRGLAESALPLALLASTSERLLAKADEAAQAAHAQLLVDALTDRDEWLLKLLPSDAADKVAPELAASRAALTESSIYRGVLFDPDTSARVAAALATAGDDVKRSDLALEEHHHAVEELDHIEKTLARVPEQERIAGLIAAKEAAALTVAGHDGRLDVLDGDLDDCTRYEDEVHAELAVAEAKRREQLADGDYVRRILESIERVRDTLQTLRTRQIENHVRKVEVAALDSFTKLMRKQGLVADISIDPRTFALTLRDGTGESIRPGSLSAGESQILAISLLWGLARVAGRPMPTVVDTPLGRLDSANRQLLVDRYFPAASTQVLLLSTDEEIDAALYARLRPQLARTYLLVHDDASGTTTIRDGFWWDEGNHNVA